MRIRLPELMEAKGLTAHALSVQSGGRISITTAYRLVANEGKLEKMSDILEALCDLLQVKPGELFERDAKPKPTAKPAKKAAKRGKA
jgi:DNA-binding Xre family transcriptional regulator